MKQQTELLMGMFPQFEFNVSDVWIKPDVNDASRTVAVRRRDKGGEFIPLKAAWKITAVPDLLVYDQMDIDNELLNIMCAEIRESIEQQFDAKSRIDYSNMTFVFTFTGE